MKVQQENLPFRAITIKLEKRSEAVALFGLVDKLEDAINMEKEWQERITKEERRLLIELSNINTNRGVRL